MSEFKFNYNYSMNEYQADAATTMIYKDKIVYPAFGLSNEAGEVLGKLKKLLRDKDGFDNISSKDRAALADELGDVLWYIAALAKDLNISMNAIANINIEKLHYRQKRGKISGSGDDR